MIVARSARRGVLIVLLAAVVLAAWPGGAGATSGNSAGADNPLTVVKAIVLGAVEGITEFLPISSTGHLLVAEKILDVGVDSGGGQRVKDATDTFTVAIQIGAIFAVLAIYRKRVLSMLEGLTGRSEEGRRSLIAVVVAFIPAAIIGVAFNKVIKDHLLAPWPVVGAWIVGGLAILAFVANQSRLRVTIPTMADLTVRHAAIIGVAQALALWPGVSRSLVTILAGLLIGMSLSAAVEFSFILGLVTLSAATVYELAKDGSQMLDVFGIATPLLATAVAAITVFLAVKFMIDWLHDHGLGLFGWYRILVGVGVGVALVTKVI